MEESIDGTMVQGVERQTLNLAALGPNPCRVWIPYTPLRNEHETLLHH